MFEKLLQFYHSNQFKIMKIIETEKIKNNERGVLHILENKNKIEVYYYIPSRIPFPSIREEYETKNNLFINNGATDIQIKDKWISVCPEIELATDLTADPEAKFNIVDNIIYILLDDSIHKCLYVGIPQIQNISDLPDIPNTEPTTLDTEAEKMKYTTIKYYLIADPIAENKYDWIYENDTNGLKYLQACADSSVNPLNYAIYRSDINIHRFTNYDVPYNVNDILNREIINLKLNLIKRVETIGTPIVHKHNRYLSNEVMRHLYFVNYIYTYFRFSDIKNICEIGGSYGILNYLLSLMFKWDKYYFVETDECINLAIKNNNILKVQNNEYVKYKSIDTIPTNDLFISELCIENLTETGINNMLNLLQKSKYFIMLIQNKNLANKIPDNLQNVLNNSLSIQNNDYTLYVKYPGN